jgi:hypothetical protein
MSRGGASVTHYFLAQPYNVPFHKIPGGMLHHLERCSIGWSLHNSFLGKSKCSGLGRLLPALKVSETPDE